MVHVRHNFETGGSIHQNVKPVEKEKIVSKDNANSSKDTDLLEFLIKNGISKLIICGMQTQMCVEAATRAASDFGFECIVIDDACATRDRTYKEYTVKSKDIHYSTLKCLENSYAKVMQIADFIRAQKNIKIG